MFSTDNRSVVEYIVNKSLYFENNHGSNISASESDLEPLRDTDANRSENAGIASGDANRSENAGIASGGSDLESLRDTDANRSENAGIASGGSDLEPLMATDANRSENAGIASGGSDLEPLMATEANRSQNAEKAPGALENISELGRTLKAAVLIFIVFDPIEKAIEDKLQKTTKHPIKDDANEFTSGKMGSQIVIMIKIKKALANSDITRYLGAFDSAGHVLIVGMCRSDESNLQNNDSMTSATDNIPCIYYGSSIVLDERTFEASNHILVQTANNIADNKPGFNLRSRENTDEHVRAFDREIKPLLESVEGNVTESFMMIHGITSNSQDSAASNAAAEFVSEIITKLDNEANRVENPNALV